MNCLRCGQAMFRVQNPDGSAKATCSRCSQYVDCARCPSCLNSTCLACYNKAVTAAGKPTQIRDTPLVDDRPEF